MGEMRETWESVKLFGPFKVIYWRLFYRRHMLHIHKRGKHVMRHYGPLLPDGGSFDKCDWCGHMENGVPARTPLMDLISKAQTPPHSGKE